MPMQPDREIINSWIGLTIDGEEIGPVTLTRLMAIGAEMVVYAATDAGGDKKWTIKFPRNHIGFVLGLPPNASFKLHDTIYSDEKMVLLTMEEYEKEQKYNVSLSQRLYALRGSPLLTEIFPLDLVWMRLANTLMEAANRRKTQRLQSPLALLSKYSALLRCKFVRNILTEWSSVDTTSSESDPSDPFLLISASFRPILGAYPSELADDATSTTVPLTKWEVK